MSSENGNKRGKNCEKNVEKRRSNHSSSRLSVTFLWKILLQQVPPFTTTAVHQLSYDWGRLRWSSSISTISISPLSSSSSPHHPSFLLIFLPINLSFSLSCCSLAVYSVKRSEGRGGERRGGGVDGVAIKEEKRVRGGVKGGEQLLSFITSKRKSAVNCLPTAYHPLHVTPPQPLLPWPPPSPRIVSLAAAIIFHSQLTAESHQLTFNASVSAVLRFSASVCPSATVGRLLPIVTPVCLYLHVFFLLYADFISLVPWTCPEAT